MRSFMLQLRWQFVLLHKNSIVNISAVVTLLYAAILFSFKETPAIDNILIVLLLNDPTMIGYFFIALIVFNETKNQLLQAIFSSPVSVHQYLLTRVISLSLIGFICSLVLVMSIKGTRLDWVSFSIGTFGACIISSLAAIVMLAFTTEFMKFTLQSIPVFLVLTGVPVFDYFDIMNIGFMKYLAPTQGCIDLIITAITGAQSSVLPGYLSLVCWIPILYLFAYKVFRAKKIYQ